MPLAEIERRTLVNLSQRKDLPVALENDRQVNYWRGLEARGYVRILPEVRIMFDRVKGDYLTITEAGRLAVTD